MTTETKVVYITEDDLERVLRKTESEAHFHWPDLIGLEFQTKPGRFSASNSSVRWVKGERGPNCFAYKYYDTDLIKVFFDGTAEVTLNGWTRVKTIQFINKVLNLYGLPRITTKKSVPHCNGEEFDVYGTLRFQGFF